MTKTKQYLLKGMRKLFHEQRMLSKPDCDHDPESASRIIFNALVSPEPQMIARFGGFELATVVNYLGVKKNPHDIIAYARGREPQWWWDLSLINAMRSNAGFFPAELPQIERFCELMLGDIPSVNILGSWLPEERFFHRELQHTYKVNLELLNPFFSENPWTRALEGKKVLVVHPFANTIKEQFAKRDLLFDNCLLPDFRLTTIKAIQSIAGEKTPFKDWFEALGFMQTEIDKVDYDIALIGCGAYGFPLAAHVKRNGKKAVHLGGSLQLLFGIRGKRWENENYNPHYNYAKLINEYWVKPGENEKPRNADSVEGACYW